MGLPGCRSHKNAHQETGCGSAPAPSCVGGGGKGCTVWERLRPSSPLPFLVSVAVLGSQPRNVPCLGELSAPVLSPQSGAVTLHPRAEHVPSPLSAGPCNILGHCSPASPTAAGATSALERDTWQSAFLMPLFQSGFLGEGQNGRDPRPRRQQHESDGCREGKSFSD